MSESPSKLKTIALMSAAFLTACSSSSIIKVTRPHSLFPPNTQDELLYADIELTNGSYRLTNISSEIQDVRLNDMSAMEINFNRDVCQRGILGLTDGACKTINSAWVNNRFEFWVIPLAWPFCLPFMLC